MWEDLLSCASLNIFSKYELKRSRSIYLLILVYFHKDLGVFIWPPSRMRTTINIISTFCSYITICWNANKTKITCLITMKRTRTTKMCCLLSSLAINFEKRVNVYFHGDRSIQEIPWDFALDIGFGTCTWTLHFTRPSPKSQVPWKLYFNGFSRLKSWDLLTWVGLETQCELALSLKSLEVNPCNLTH